MLPTAKIRLWTLSVLLVAGFSSPSVGQDAEKVALITDIQGTVEVASVSGSSTSKAAWGTQLFEGDQVNTLEGGAASILFSNGNLISMGQNSSMTISSGATPSSDKESESDRTVSSEYLADASDLTLYRAGPGEIGALGGLRSSGSAEDIELLTPRNTRIKDQRPSFSWETNGDFELFIVKVLSDDGIVWESETEEHSITYPDDAPALNPDVRYFWQVEGELMLNTVSSPLVSFEVLSGEALSAVEEGESKIHSMFKDDLDGTNHLFVLGTFYAREGLLGAAIQSFSKIAEKHPEAARPQEILGKLYYDVDLKDEAVQALQKAVQLEQQD